MSANSVHENCVCTITDLTQTIGLVKHQNHFIYVKASFLHVLFCMFFYIFFGVVLTNLKDRIFLLIWSKKRFFSFNLYLSVIIKSLRFYWNMKHDHVVPFLKFDHLRNLPC